ncbi:histidine phosphatase family protein [Rhizobium leguminosarum]|uniref:histidine phosphatase family protein n=1 Tax=Rhizobium TaxID=379 RepID=UPI0014786291|nr:MULTISPECIES: histidine phosphatase family protein [Rhizobium]MBY5352345.1 histidine phosphatase family protein [Rhizobium leguminosarum]MBY5442527.1 histidine phosphatase family protein [Rhizobium leguminosarum]NNH40490.1 histidine phosphatase family protein [Rhizobium laguerreae]UWM79773.1 histidine phosphatase family protein [Rhizobium leguminosarum bv. viciae]UWU26530.1 histidine phosphatase family protein [Rhizobium leguminosarum bv. viciae]
MTVTFFLVRHAAHDNVGNFLAGCTAGISLGEAGRSQVQGLGQRLRREDITEIYTSPRERTRETAEGIASACGLSLPQTDNALDEVNFGDWSGKTFEVLNDDPLWRRWNTTRSLTRTPGGETMLDVQTRIFGLMETLASGGDKNRIALVSHADVIKAGVSHVLGLPIDAWPRFDIAPASVTTVVIGDWGAKVMTLNEVTL